MVLSDPLGRASAHLRTLVTTRLGPEPFWPAELIATTAEPIPVGTPARLPGRCYRSIASPRGANLYWDLPQLVAAHRMAAVTGAADLSAAADAYAASWLTGLRAPSGLLRWGNHYYWSFDRRAVVHFVDAEDPFPVPDGDDGEYHEMRPLPTAWGVLRRVDASATEAALTACRGHIVREDGAFNRHATGDGTLHAFLESGAILALGWAEAAAAGGPAWMAAEARRIIAFSANQRGASGLLRNSQLVQRWDGVSATSEVGMWAGAVARCGEVLADPDLVALAAEVLGRWLELAWDESAGRFRGRLLVADGAHDRSPRTTVYQPGEWCDAWDPLFPAHDYPMACAEACLRLHRLTGAGRFADGARRWMRHLDRQGRPCQPGLDGTAVPGTCAEHYGRAIHALDGIARQLGDTTAAAMADQLAIEAVSGLWTGRMFRGRIGDDRYGAVDGVGILILALLGRSEVGEGDGMGFLW